MNPMQQWQTERPKKKASNLFLNWFKFREKKWAWFEIPIHDDFKTIISMQKNLKIS